MSARRRVEVALELRVGRRTAERLGLAGRVLGRTGGVLGYNESRGATLRLTRRARRALADQPRLRATVRLTLPRSTARDRVLTVPVTL